MTKRIETIPQFEKKEVYTIDAYNNVVNKINKNSIIIVDLDGTLIDTDKANFLAYRDAIKKVKNVNLELLYNNNERFTREKLLTIIPNLEGDEYSKITEIKTAVFHKYLEHTKLNNSVYENIKFFSKTNQVILATNSHKIKANLLLDHYGLFNLFDKKYYKEDYTSIKNKYKFILNDLNLAPYNIVIFEDDDFEIEKAKLLKIPSDNIIYPTTKGEKIYA